MAKTDKKGNWIDGAGNSVPKRYVDPVDKRRDVMVEKIFKEAIAVAGRIKKLRKMVTSEVEKYLDQGAEENKVERNKGGNYRLTGFSGDKRLQIKVVKFIDFDERLQFAKQKIDNCLERWSQGANGNLRAVVFDAFKVDTKGRVDTKRILGLRKLNIKDAEWQQAMELISKAVTVVSAKAYVIFETREQLDKDWETLRIDIAAY